MALARTLREAILRAEPDETAPIHLGAVDTALSRARAVLAEAATVADDPATARAEASLVAQRARRVVNDAADEVLRRVGDALGPSDVDGDGVHARRLADLAVHLRRHRADRDLLRQGERVLDDPPGWRWWCPTG